MPAYRFLACFWDRSNEIITSDLESRSMLRRHCQKTDCLCSKTLVPLSWRSKTEKIDELTDGIGRIFDLDDKYCNVKVWIKLDAIRL